MMINGGIIMGKNGVLMVNNHRSWLMIDGWVMVENRGWSGERMVVNTGGS